MRLRRYALHLLGDERKPFTRKGGTTGWYLGEATAFSTMTDL